MASGQEYQYTGLSPGPVFRFLILQPGQGKETLKCSIYTSLLNEAPDYEAVSYVWGLRTRDQTIMCNGKALMITQSLTKVLHRLRLPNDPRVLWADSICINQEDNAEKGHQVGLMANIYLRAKRTLICMGDDTWGHAKAAFEMIEEVNLRIEESCKRAEGPWAMFPPLNPQDPITGDTRWNSVAALYRSPWFGRGWVVQEAWLAREGLVIWGQHETRWAKLMRVDVWVVWCAPSCSRTFNLGSPALHWQGYFARHQNEMSFFSDFEGSKDLNLLSTLEGARLLGLTDPRDRIYAFLEMLESDNGRKGLQLFPNYEQNFFKVYEEFARTYIRTKRSVELLDYVQHVEHTLDAELPSWVPRWDLQPEAGSRMYLPIWPALTDRSSSIPDPSTTDSTLSVRAVVLDSVVYVSKALPARDIPREDIVDIWKAIAHFEASPYPVLCRFHAYIETLYGGIQPAHDLEVWRRAQAAYLLDIHRNCGETEPIDSQYWVETAKGGEIQVYNSLLQILLRGKRIFLTRCGLLGTTYTIRKGDWCGIIFGCKTLSILRKVEGIEKSYKLLGPAHVTGTTPQIYKDRFRGFTMLGWKESKEWTEWDVREGAINLH
ncbi:heterokaryon incompatibility protein-domain-containing protein [Nemania sp. FL0031]|nr:heterokaryon incompatibility protein-domain-containing protein [Nemania sp. FL0031]